MKKLFVFGLFVFGFMYQKADAQIRIGLNINIGTQPVWGPVGYDHVDYYYMPDIDAYYYVPQRQFIYLEGNRWVFAASLPARYRGYDLYGGYKVVINEPRPYLRNTYYRTHYVKYKNWRGPRQVVIRDSHDNRYVRARENEHRDKGRGHDNGRHGH